MKTCTLADIDAAIDFAYANRRGIAFCGKMVKYFEAVGNLTHAQVHALLQIKNNLR
jgi:hypothetical protein